MDSIVAVRHVNDKSEATESAEKSTNETERCTHEFFTASNELATSMVKVIRLMKHMQPEVRRNNCMRICLETTRSMLGLSQPTFKEKNDAVVALSNAMSDQGYSYNQWLKCLECMYDVIDEKIDVTSESDYPSYSLGLNLTQDGEFSHDERVC